MSVIILDDEIVHYEVLGRGRPLVFLHGWVGSWRYWIPCMQATSISFRAYALDLWGFGDTSKNAAYYSLERQVGLLDQFLQELGVGKIGLIGHGLGAVAAFLFARRHPQSVDRVMAISLPLAAEDVNLRLRSAAPDELAAWLLGGSSTGDAARSEAPKADRRAIAASLDDLAGQDLLAQSASLATPLLLVYGQDDPVYTPPEGGLLLADPLHQIIFSEAGHFPMLDKPNKFNRLLADFLALGPGESPQKLQIKDEWRRRVR
jgi:pimeloyl-ACP methyl ester carboxylesterase